MDYGYLKFKAQNGKSGIFWEQEKKKADRKFGYKRKDQRFTIRKDPNNTEDLEPEPGKDDDSTPKPNFIERNRHLAASKNKGKKPTLRPLKQSPTGTVTLTQDQLNAILASVGKVATGEEDNLRISIDSKKNSITIESPRKSRDGDYYDHHSAESGYDDDDEKYNDNKKEKEVKTKTKKARPTKEEETTIFSLLEEFSPETKKPSKSSKKEHTEDKNKKKERKKVDDENNNYGSDRENVNERRGRKEESSREIRRGTEKQSKVRNRSRDRERSRKRDGSQSRERDRRRRRNDSENDNDKDDREISPERKSRTKREKNETQKNRKNISKDRENDRHKASEDDESDKKEETVEKKMVTPREIAGIPMSLPWKHMTVGERRRLMLARIEAEAAIKEIEKKKFEIEEREKMNDEDTSRGRGEHERNDRKRNDRESERKDKDHYRKDYDRTDRDSKRKEKERDRNNHRDDRDDHDDHRSRHNKKGSRERRRYSPEQQESDDDDYYDRDHRKKDSRSHRRKDSPDSRERRRRDRRRDRTPSDDDQDEKNTSHRTEEKSPDRAASKPPTGLPPPPKPLTLAEKKKLQWERDRLELEKQYDPWGRPGAGAPIRTKSGNVVADYKTRQEETLRASMEEMEVKKQEQKEALIREMEKNEPTPKAKASQNNVPHAMRSSFMFGQVAPDSNQFENTKEFERQQWLQELDKQKEEKRLRQNNSKANTANQETWADKFTYHKPAGYPDQLREPPAGYPDPFSPRDKTLDGGRVNSAPSHIPDKDEDMTHIRGQNVFMDPVTRNELEEKRKRLLEHQQAVMEQVQQKQREKQRERELKLQEDMEGEIKLQAERDRIQRQFDQEQTKIKMKEVRRQQEVDQLKMAMDEAHESALREKITRRMQHLEEGGHDTTHLKATLQDLLPNTAKLTPRNNNPSTHVQPEYVPGLSLELSPRTGPTHRSHREAQILDNAPYIENRVLTPSRFRHGIDASREFGTQTGMGRYTPPVSDDKTVHDNDLCGKVEFGTNTELGTRREESEVRIMYNAQGKRVRVKSAAKEETKKYQRKPEPPMEQKSKSRPKEEKEKGKPKWNFQNKRRKRPVKQSEKDINFQEKRKQSEVRRLKREQELMNLVDMNRDRIPGYKGANSRGHSPVSDHEGHRSRSERFNASRRSKSHSPVNVSARREQTYRMTSPNLTQRSSSPGPKVVGPIESSHNTARGRSPPVPALRFKKDNAYDVHLAEKQSARKYADGNPLDIPLMEGEFVPFMRTVEVLDPAHAGSPVPISREATAVVNARKAYLKGMKPGDYGNKANNYEDRLKVPGEEKSNDPIMNPALVKDHPTHRQEAILQQLSSLKMNLMQRRRELETFSPSDFE
ncbi:trichohyalin-like isoform X2 [Mizuhopecten yessoensis]|uniref:trichohyalin-like isoform X2 n=1 Tax=Mizuhopecten yessoensis TaxID=6573 RepID=UPI000B459A87|nr:trichohyalin-like isoform X2 [Mizuhopecten yessoensis]